MQYARIESANWLMLGSFTPGDKLRSTTCGNLHQGFEVLWDDGTEHHLYD